MLSLLKLIDTIIWLYTIVLFVHIILSWLVAFNVMNSRHPLVVNIQRVTFQLCEPVLAPIRRFLPRMNIDLSPVILLILVHAVDIYFLLPMTVPGYMR